MIKLLPGNIWSGSDTLAMFTNANDLAYKKGKTHIRYPIIYKGREYSDVEKAYNRYKGNKTTDKRVELLTQLIFIKLETYPELYNIIEYNGGIDWLKKCSHNTKGWSNSTPGLWEGSGDNSLFIKCLMKAYMKSLDSKLIKKRIIQEYYMNKMGYISGFL